MIRGVLQILPVFITVESAIFLLMSNLFPSSISLLKKKSKNSDVEIVIKDIARQSANTWIGILLLTLSAVFQIYNIYDYPTSSEMGNPPISSFYYTTIISILIFVGCIYLSKYLKNVILSKVS